MRRVFCIVLCVLLLSSYAFAAEEETLAEQLNSYIYNNGLTRENFALSYHNVNTNESYHYNENAFFAAGDVWLLPLHMYYCIAEDRGDFEPQENDPDYRNPNYEYTIGGMNLDTCRTEGIFKDDQKVNKAMRDEVDQYADTINRELGFIPEEDLPVSYYTDDVYSTTFLMNCMKTLERTPEIFEHMLATYNMVRFPDGFQSADYPVTNKYKTFQIRGEEDGMICAVAEISAPDTYLLTCFVSQEAGGDRVLAEINEIICEYVQTHSRNGKGEVEDSASVGMIRTDSSFQVNQKNSDDFGAIGKWILIALAAVVALVAVLYLIDRVIYRIKHRQ